MVQYFSVKVILEAVDQSFSSTIERVGQSVQNFGSSTAKRLAGVGKAMTVAGLQLRQWGLNQLRVLVISNSHLIKQLLLQVVRLKTLVV